MSEAARRLADTARALLETGGGATESTGAAAPVDPARLQAAIEAHLAAAGAGRGRAVPLAEASAAARVVRHASEGLAFVAGGGSPSNLTDLQISSLEAIVHLTGRPAVGYRNGQVQMPPTDLGENERWRVLVAIERSEIDRVSASVGRIALRRPGGGDEPIGTGWRAKADLLVTNRHVAGQFAADPAKPPSTWTLDGGKSPVIDFGVSDAAAAAGPRFAVSGIAFCADEPELDLALLTLDAGGGTLPPALPINLSPSSIGRTVPGAAGAKFRGGPVYVVGHPFRRLASAESAVVFGIADASKRWSPGMVTSVRGDSALVEHDCSTLSGNSGSCVFMADGHQVVGVHVGGLGVTDVSGGRGDANVAIALTRLQSHRAAAVFLR